MLYEVITMREHGIWKMQYDKGSDSLSFHRLTAKGSIVYKMGLGVIEKGADYLKTDKAIYAAAEIGGEYGFYRSLDDVITSYSIHYTKLYDAVLVCSTASSGTASTFATLSVTITTDADIPDSICSVLSIVTSMA